MNPFLTFFLFAFCSISVLGQTTNTRLDTNLAKKLEADDYGMKKYVFVVLKSGDYETSDKKFIDSCFKGHLFNINRLVDQKLLVIAGPFGKNQSDFRGLFILNVKTIAEATELLESDPAIKSNLLKAELFQWYGSAALPEYLDVHDRIWKLKP